MAPLGSSDSRGPERDDVLDEVSEADRVDQWADLDDQADPDAPTPEPDDFPDDADDADVLDQREAVPDDDEDYDR